MRSTWHRQLHRMCSKQWFHHIGKKVHVCNARRLIYAPRNPWIFKYFSGFFGYFRDFWSNIRVFGQNNVIFELLQQKWCRIIMSFRQNTISGPETYQIRPKVLIWSCPDLSRRTHMGPIWAHMGPYGPIRAHKGPYGPIWAPTRTGPQPGLGPNPGHPGFLL